MTALQDLQPHILSYHVAAQQRMIKVSSPGPGILQLNPKGLSALFSQVNHFSINHCLYIFALES